VLFSLGEKKEEVEEGSIDWEGHERAEKGLTAVLETGSRPFLFLLFVNRLLVFFDTLRAEKEEVDCVFK